MDLSIAEDQTQGSHPTYQATSRRALWWVTAVLLAGIIAIVLPIQKIRMLGAQLGGTIGSYTTNPPPAPQYAAISPGGSSLTVYWSQVSAATSYSVYRSDLKDSQGHPYAIGSGNSTSSGSFTDQSATSGKSYTYWVTASNGGAESGASPSVSATVNTPTPPSPAHGKLIVSGGSIKAYFSTVTGASSYNAYRDGWLMQTGVTSPYTDSGVPVGTSHWYTFGAVNSNGQGSMGPYYLSGTGGATPPVTTNLAATAGNNSVQLSWNVVTDATGGSVSYNLYRSSSAGGEGDVPVQNWISSNNSGPMSYTDNDVVPGTTYYYKVAAVSYTGGEGTLSNEASATPLTPLLPAPNLSGAPGDGSAVLTWTTVAGASSYNVYRNNEYEALGSSKSGKVPLVKVGASGTTYTDSGLTNGNWYYYSVNAVSSDGQGLSSQSVTVIPGSGSPTLAAHIVWTSDYTVTPNVQTGSTSGMIAGETRLHLSLQVPPNLTSAVASNITIHEDAGDTQDVTATNVNFTVADSYTNYYQWSAVCGDPDPKKPGSPGMAYCDVPWGSTGSHNGNYTITVNGQATVGNSFTPVPVTSTIHVDLENLLIKSTTPANPAPILYDPTKGPVSLQAAITCAYKANVPLTLTIYDTTQNAVRTFSQSLAVTGDASSGTTTSISWDGRANPVGINPGPPSPKGVYLFQWNVGGNGFDTDTDKSTTLSFGIPATSISINTDANDASWQSITLGYQLADTLNNPASACQVDVYQNWDLTDALSAVPIPTTLGNDEASLFLPDSTSPPDKNAITRGTKLVFLVSPTDADSTHDKGHRNRVALQHNSARYQYTLLTWGGYYPSPTDKMSTRGINQHGETVTTADAADGIAEKLKYNLWKERGYFRDITPQQLLWAPMAAVPDPKDPTGKTIARDACPNGLLAKCIDVAVFCGHGGDENHAGEFFMFGTAPSDNKAADEKEIYTVFSSSTAAGNNIDWIPADAAAGDHSYTLPTSQPGVAGNWSKMRLVIWAGCNTASAFDGSGLPSSTVANGAQCSIGLTATWKIDNITKLMKCLASTDERYGMKNMKAKQTVYQALHHAVDDAIRLQRFNNPLEWQSVVGLAFESGTDAFSMVLP